MTDEEKAEEYVNETFGRTNPIVAMTYTNIYLEGLAEGKPKWHDLRKNPNDLPREKTMYRVIYDNPMINRPAMWYLPNLKAWECSDLPVIAWCELPKFEE